MSEEDKLVEMSPINGSFGFSVGGLFVLYYWENLCQRALKLLWRFVVAQYLTEILSDGFPIHNETCYDYD